MAAEQRTPEETVELMEHSARVVAQARETIRQTREIIRQCRETRGSYRPNATEPIDGANGDDE